jgi:membrane protease YdiL (CAAX protease family)
MVLYNTVIMKIINLFNIDVDTRVAQWCMFGALVSGLAALAFRQQRKKLIYSFKKEKWKIIGTALLWAVGLIFLTGLLMTLVNFLQGHQTEQSLNQQFLDKELQQRTGWDKALLGLQIVFWAPFFEELLFRWLVFEAFGKNYFSVLISTFTFAFAHYLGGQNVIIMIPYLIMGAAFAYIYRKKDYNILWTMAFHFSWNLIAFLFMLNRL